MHSQTGTYVRKNAWNNGGDFTNQDLLWYAKGVGVMMSRALNDRASWWFFAAIHGEYLDASGGTQFPYWGAITSPPTVPTSPMPTQGVQDLYWNQCQHGSWYFLPWHRGYLMALEAQLRADIVSLGGPADWALPYWNYFGGDNGSQYTMPPAFAQTTLPDGTPNPLYVAMRYGPNNDGNIFILTAAAPGGGAVTQDCMNQTVYTGVRFFGGGKTTFSHSGALTGRIESNPHNIVHVEIGGGISNTNYGLMSDPGLAGLDPIFYMHHCNIDRMWGVWNAMGNANPTDPAWLNGPPKRKFVMPWPGQKLPWYYTPMQVTNLATLNYSYQEISAARVEDVFMRRLNRLGATRSTRITAAPAMTLSEQPELLGASKGAVTIQGDGARAINVKLDADVHQKVMRSFMRSEEGPLPDRTYLQLENVRGVNDGTVLGAYVNLPDNATPEQRAASFVGDISLFGLRRASAADGDHGGGGLTLFVDITRVVDEMAVNDGLDVGSIQVSLLPKHPLKDGDSITVGRIGVYREEQ